MGKDNIKSAEKEQKPINKKAKFIWLGISVVILIAGVLIVKSGVSFDNIVIKAVFAAAVLVPLFIAAQKISCERIKPDGKRNIVAYVLYYLIITLFVILIPFIFWIDQFVSLF